MRQVEHVPMNLRQYQIHKVTQCKIPKANRRTYIFQRRFLVDLYSVPLIFERVNFQMWRLRKELGQRVRIYYSHKLRLLPELRDTNFKKKKRYKKFTLQFALKVCNKYILFWRGSEGLCVPLRRNPFLKRINNETRISFHLKTT